jgi:3-hydroxy-9,10-secoandrosta-1,3,5(10)-triene-9,17-dione monooxygenase reductase component
MAAAHSLRVLEAAPADAERPALRTALGEFPTGVTVVTSAGGAGSCGVTVNSFTSLSLDPPLVMVCLSARSSSAFAIARNRVFAVNVLSAHQEALGRRFASGGRPRGRAAFTGVPYRIEATGSPILDGVACWLDCRLEAVHAGGDHVIAIGLVLEFGSAGAGEPLVFHAGRYCGLAARTDRSIGRRSIPFRIPLSCERR